VSCVQFLCLISIAEIACIKSHLGCESFAGPQLDFYCWYCLHKISSSLWVLCSSSAWFPLLILPVWNSIQSVSPVQLFCLIFIADIACMKSHSVCESCPASLLDFYCWHCLYKIPSSLWVVCSSAWFSLLILTVWNPMQSVSCVQLCLISSADITCIKFHAVCELCIAPLLYFYFWHCLHEILSRMWVMCSLLDFNFWHYLYEILSRKWVMCNSSAWF